jgi:hypothetical protein
MTVCGKHYPIPCQCPSCQNRHHDAAGNDTYNRHLKHVLCELPHGHAEPHKFILPDNTILTEPATDVRIGTVILPSGSTYDVYAVKSYGITAPGRVTSNGVASMVADCLFYDINERGATWTGPKGTSAESLRRALLRFFYATFPQAYEMKIETNDWDPRGPEFQWPTEETT